MRALLVEDDEMIAASLRQGLAREGWSLDWSADGLSGERALADGAYACVLLDLGLPGQEGTALLRRARARGDRTPVVVLTARDGLDDRVAGLDLGADDYLPKPFALRELLARMRAVVRRHGGTAQPCIGTPQLQLDLATRELKLQGGRREPLSAREFALMHALLERPGAVLSRAQLEQRLYGWDDEVSSNALDVLIYGLRRRLGPEAIRNVRGLGWRVSAAAAAAPGTGPADAALPYPGHGRD
ncbi:two-component system OmpR family response regulator/two-component system response regulator QseB [Pseudacidovorax intermedius]|uniref:Two-component system OmpR family response regulator/two-component system response regulator QseB n=1 Tax=Pseudacidovorax intermedius TaxID=433924 RepID=A0A370FLT2_9BURK|nr:response regulator transcription factor [Pseudacidovorax intermedius]RDI28647.1 two-component system OmpR family response regulator/two-component system response regulator QseB [Pseudacidovorax intermedius]